MSTTTHQDVIYPDSDGQPMAENTLQFEWITTIKWGLEAVFRDDPDVFVAGDLLWYPVEGDNKTRTAPDAMVAFGRPKGYRGSYMQWIENGVAPQVVFEVLSPGNRTGELQRKLQFYERFGVEEYYIYDPDRYTFNGWRRRSSLLEPVANLNRFVSPRLGVRFEPGEGDLTIYGPDGRPFATYMELFEQRDAEAARADDERQRADDERQRADIERQRADIERQRADRLAARLKALGLDLED
ncbi:MAG: Uma2 family endonuclease [Isosphaeraceae bacterium]